MNQSHLPVAAGPAPSTPPRAPWSIRRTSTIDTRWPQGPMGAMEQSGCARDLLTGALEDSPTTIAQDRFTATLTFGREIAEVASDPARSQLRTLVGARAGGQLRAAINETLPRERDDGTPLYLLLDDIAGASLVAPWAWSQWTSDWAERIAADLGSDVRRRNMEGVCIGFRPGSPALIDGLPRSQQNSSPVAALDAGADPYAWHEIAEQSGPSARRARRIDVVLDEEKNAVAVTAHFQDSATMSTGGRSAVHEYLLSATADLETMTLMSIEADPRILPYEQCPSAILNLGRLVGSRLATLRQRVLQELARTEGCTHLNDMARSLSEVPQLTAILLAARHKSVTARTQ